LKPNDYCFEFSYPIPKKVTAFNKFTELPGSFLLRKDVKDVGRIDIRVKYKIKAALTSINK
jgi:hypothetical protein